MRSPVSLQSFRMRLPVRHVVFELIEEEPEMADAQDAAVLTHADGSVELSHVNFSYTKEQKLITGF